MPLIESLVELVDSKFILLQLHQLLPIPLFLLPDLIMQFLRGEIEHLLHLRSIKLRLTVTPLPYLEIVGLYLYLLVVYNLFCSFLLGVMQAAPLAQQSKRIVKLFSDFIHLLSMITL